MYRSILGLRIINRKQKKTGRDRPDSQLFGGMGFVGFGFGVWSSGLRRMGFEVESCENGAEREGLDTRADIIAARICDKCPVCLSIRLICTKFCFTMTNMIQVCTDFD